MYILASGKSMLPTLEDGKYYKIDNKTKGKYKVGDIIVYQVKGTVICHRIVKIYFTRSNKTFIKTKGDNCEKADAYAVTIDDIIGKINIWS